MTIGQLENSLMHDGQQRVAEHKVMCERCRHDKKAAKECFIDHEMRSMAKKSNKKLTHQEMNEAK